ncbi:PspC domain-containing protein [Brevibacterium sediminis]|uniref:PspC domain-containing protein n=1 Tax=Brevibacterium sediminis TaxID=1857024 RepID=UPI0021750DBC|nr:PspC domain-containing protein [Brevibacterium sediminis]MCS4592645.1 PspC domain-containing protein [Brevibacterium sediminis]
MIDHPTHSVASLIEFLPAHWFDAEWLGLSPTTTRMLGHALLYLIALSVLAYIIWWFVDQIGRSRRGRISTKRPDKAVEEDEQ